MALRHFKFEDNIFTPLPVLAQAHRLPLVMMGAAGTIFAAKTVGPMQCMSTSGNQVRDVLAREALVERHLASRQVIAGNLPVRNKGN
jgi:hypothetical protein